MTGGSPCQGVTRVNVEAKGWQGDQTRLVAEIPRVANLAQEAAPTLTVLQSAENVSSMSADDREKFSELLRAVPIELCASGR